MRGTTQLLLLGFVLGVTATSEADGQVTQQRLREFTQTALRNGWVDYTPPSFDWQSNPMRYFLGCVDLASSSDLVGTSKDGVALHVQPAPPIEWPLYEQFIVTLIRSYRNAPRQQLFWRPVLRRVETEIGGMLNDIQNPAQTAQQNEGLLWARYEKIRRIYQQELDALARRQGYVGAEEGFGPCYACAGYKVTLRTDPEAGQIFYMSQGQWELYKFMRSNGHPEYPRPTWTRVAQAEGVPLMGRNIFYVRWPDLGGYFFNNIRITSEKPIVFTPRGIRYIYSTYSD